jgi:CheY-like chemotaxis protein/anti-sigma regulatory factor (Ser/Thr protein kinase)
MARILVAEDSRTQAQQIRLLLEEVPYEVELATDGQEAMKALGRSLPDIALTDLEMPNMNGLELVEAIRRKYPTVPVVLMTAHGSEEIAAMALNKGAASYIPKAYLNHDLVPTLERLLALSSINRQHSHAFDCLTQSEFHFVLDNDPALVAPIIGYLDDALSLLKMCDATERMRVGVALQEAFLNAIYHGNLEVASNLRQDDEMIFYNLAKLRRGQAPYQNRRVYLDANITPEEARYTIRDEGPGFDPSVLPDPGDPENLEKIGGRGIYLIRTFMDHVHHNDSGNAITLLKRRDPDLKTPN